MYLGLAANDVLLYLDGHKGQKFVYGTPNPHNLHNLVSDHKGSKEVFLGIPYLGNFNSWIRDSVDRTLLVELVGLDINQNNVTVHDVTVLFEHEYAPYNYFSTKVGVNQLSQYKIVTLPIFWYGVLL